MLIVNQVLDREEIIRTGKEIVRVVYDWFECEKGRILKKAEDGTEIGVVIPGGVKRGDVLLETDSKVYVVEIAPAKLIEVKIGSREEAAKAGFELGNRHLSLKIEDERILVPFDQPTFDYLRKKGFQVDSVTEVFDDITVCKAHGHSHAAGSAPSHSHESVYDHAAGSAPGHHHE